MHGGHVVPHSVPGGGLDGETPSVDVEEDTAIFFFFLLFPTSTATTGGLPAAAAGLFPDQQAVRAGALGAAVSTQLCR